MKKERKRIPKRLLSFVLSIVLLFGLLPASVFAASDRTAPAEYTVAAYGGTIVYADREDTFHKTAPADAALTIRFDESQFPGKTFDCWKSADGTEIPKKTFRLLVKTRYCILSGIQRCDRKLWRVGNFHPGKTVR